MTDAEYDSDEELLKGLVKAHPEQAHPCHCSIHDRLSLAPLLRRSPIRPQASSWPRNRPNVG